MLPVIPQYSVRRILVVWAAAAVPMAALGWFVAPVLVRNSANPLLTRLAALTTGLVWQFLLAAILIYDEAGTLR
jgi:hypothetical protein